MASGAVLKPRLFAETKKGSRSETEEPATAKLGLDQRIELSPPRAPVRSTITIVVRRFLHGLMRLMDTISDFKTTLSRRPWIGQASCSRRDKLVQASTNHEAHPV
jgi:hypothetical protein